MKNYIEIENDVVKTNLKYTKNNEVINFVINENELELSLKDVSCKVVLDIQKDVNITNFLSFNELDITYNIAENINVNEFLVIESDNVVLKLNKNVVLLDNSFYEVSCAFFNDANIYYDIIVDLNGINAKAIHNVASIARKDNKKIFNVRINNNCAQSIGDLNNFGVVKDEATLIFNGTGYIKNKATNAKAHQESRIITFSKNVIAQANPYLLIDEADVEASHAAAVGQMDEEQLYYLQTRGIDNDTASQLITYGYLKPILRKIKNDDLRDKLDKLIEDKVMI